MSRFKLSIIFFVKLIVTVSSIGADNCTIYKDSLASAIAQFTDCAITFSRPITLCEKCVDTYINVLDSYRNLTNSESETGHCIDEFVNLDRLQIVQTLYRNTYDLWTRAKCYECFQIKNGVLTHNVSAETEKFKQLLNETFGCINDTSYNESLYCDYCLDEYLELNKYYISISNINEKIGVCMDIVDLMNDTRTMWSKKCCEYRNKKDWIFVGSTVIVTVLTILFYILAKLCTDLKKPEIIHQSRFTGSRTHLDSTAEQTDTHPHIYSPN